MSKISSLIRFYTSHPVLLIKHSVKAVLFVLTGRFKDLKNYSESATNAIQKENDQYIENDRARRKARSLFDQRKAVQENYPGSLVKLLLPYCDDLLILEVVNDLHQQARIVMAHVLKKYSLFDADFYRKRYLEGHEGITPLDHYISSGMDFGLWPNAFFDPAEYVLGNPDVVNSGLDPILHYALIGYKEGRSPGSFFDHAFYSTAYPDVEKTELPPLAHFLKFGRRENRKPIRYASSRRLSGANGDEYGEQVLKRNRGVLLLVSHDAEIGGAQTIIKNLARWLISSTQFDVKLLCMRGGPDIGVFEKIAPVFDYGGHVKTLGEDKAKHELEKWIGDGVQAVFLNSVASGEFFDAWQTDAPVVSYIHELTKIIDHYGDNVGKIISGSDKVIAGSGAVLNNLVNNYGLPAEKGQVVYDFVESFDEALLSDFGAKSEAKNKIGLDEETFLVLGCGNVHWRKSPQKFIDAADELRRLTDRKFKFIWIGGGEDFDECVLRVKSLGLTDVVEFVGHQDDIQPYCDACDLFLLTSEEDPFPLVCMYAAISFAPVICFEDAGGMPEFTQHDSGAAVPFMNIEAMAEAVHGFMTDDAKRKQFGENARNLALKEFTIASAGPRLLHAIREAAGLAPKVSVIVPNYNYADYLRERWDTICGQTYQDFEVILLDDQSTDNSVELLEAFVRERPGTTLICNEENSGSPFRQWMKGIQTARAELIWIAEADDFAEAELLESLLPMMDDRNVFLSYVKSVPVTSDGKIAGDYEELYLNRINEGRWSAPYQCSDHTEVNEGLGIANCIPNASSVMLRKFEPEPEFIAAVSDMKLCGDWFFYLRAIYGGEIGYCSRALNYHRRHANTVTSRMEGSPQYFDELQTVRNFVTENYRQTGAAEERIRKFVIEDLDRFGISDASQRDKILSSATRRSDEKQLPTLAVVVADLSPGGGQVFAVSLANGWAARGGRVCLFNLGQLPSHESVLGRIDSRVVYYDLNTVDRRFEEIVSEFDVDVIHSSIWWGDRFVHDNIHRVDPSIGWIVSMHGCIETILDDPDIDKSFPKRFDDMKRKVDHWAYTANKNLRVFDTYGMPESISRIDNGIASKTSQGLSRTDLGVREDALLLCLATRAIPEKGWYHAVDMVKALNEAGIATDLMLIGAGKAEETLRKAAPEHVHFFGQVANLQDYLAAADIGLLPSYFQGESFPLVMLEMMAQGKPVVATDIGEIEAILGTEKSERAGLIVPLVNGEPDVPGFVRAISELADAQVRQQLGRQAIQRFESNFTMDIMLEKFESLYEEILSEKRRTKPAAKALEKA